MWKRGRRIRIKRNKILAVLGRLVLMVFQDARTAWHIEDHQICHCTIDAWLVA